MSDVFKFIQTFLMCFMSQKLWKKRFIKESQTYSHRHIALWMKNCGKTFIARDKMIVHRRLYTRERPYICTTCGRGRRLVTRRMALAARMAAKFPEISTKRCTFVVNQFICPDDFTQEKDRSSALLVAKGSVSRVI